MTDVIYDYITTGVDLLINAVILSGIIMLLYTSTSLAQTISTQQYASAKVQYYREFNMYDDKVVSPSDVIGCLLYYRDNFDIKVFPTGYDPAHDTISTSNALIATDNGELQHYPFGHAFAVNPVNSTKITQILMDEINTSHGKNGIDVYYKAYVLCEDAVQGDKSTYGLNGSVRAIYFYVIDQ